jgi:hypothetical protein
MPSHHPVQTVPAPGEAERAAPDPNGVLSCAEVGRSELEALAACYGLDCHWVASGLAIPGSYWGPPEAGLVGRRLYLRDDTPLHSALHEACHWVCMKPTRRAVLHTDAGGDFAEEDAVCYLQILLSDTLPGVGRGRLLRDMDAWGYTFRLGSAQAWFERDAAEARQWLLDRGLITPGDRPTWVLRGAQGDAE